MNDIANLGTMTQKEDDGSYSAVVAMTGLHSEEMANMLCEVMSMAIDKYFGKHGLAKIIKKSDVN